MSIVLTRHCGPALSPDLEEYVFHKRNNYAMRLLIYSLTTLTPLENIRPYFIFRASRSVSRSINISFILIDPLTFLVRIRPLSLPSRILTLTWITSPAIPVRPTIWITSAGFIFSSDDLLIFAPIPFSCLLAVVWN